MKTARAIQRAGKGVNALSSSRTQTNLLGRAISSTAITRTYTPTSASSPARPICLALTSTFQIQNRRTYASSSEGRLNRTSLYDLHLEHGAKMVPFGGFDMPVQYSGLSVSASHHFTREKASLFDVGHMVQHMFSGPGATEFLESITPSSLSTLPTHHSTLSALLWPETGGIVDDTVITRLSPLLFYVVTNAACREKDLKYLSEQLAAWNGREVNHEVQDGWGLIALQGPLSAEILESILVSPEDVNLKELYFGQSRFANVKGGQHKVLISRGGYTGEDGFEISISPQDTVSVTQTLLETAGPEKVQLAGLGARDSLRLEAGMCLYGHDLDDTTTPVEGGLSWIVGKDRRTGPTKFHGSDVILAQLTPKSKGGAGVSRRRIGLIVEGAPAREGAEIIDESGENVGVITSGCPSPTLGKNIAMAYVKDGLHKSGTEVQVKVRGKARKAIVTKMPFVPAKYWKSTAPA
ncbi:hypothetical protein GGR57DRAFT_212922 [Xylariaceae sp. FL1272]|nr:hypothetical protein GGR57DRAFT_212922 [Xylariaceae sp. FL1272]